MPEGKFKAESEDSFMIIEDIFIDPVVFPTLLIEAVLYCGNESENNMDIYWSSAIVPGFSEERKLSFSWPADGKTRQMRIPLDRNIKILLDRPIKDIRIDFTQKPGEIHLRKLELLPE